MIAVCWKWSLVIDRVRRGLRPSTLGIFPGDSPMGTYVVAGRRPGPAGWRWPGGYRDPAVCAGDRGDAAADGNAASARGAAWQVAEAISTGRACKRRFDDSNAHLG